jgi:hypothetical protein
MSYDDKEFIILTDCKCFMLFNCTGHLWLQCVVDCNWNHQNWTNVTCIWQIKNYSLQIVLFCMFFLEPAQHTKFNFALKNLEGVKTVQICQSLWMKSTTSWHCGCSQAVFIRSVLFIQSLLSEVYYFYPKFLSKVYGWSVWMKSSQQLKNMQLAGLALFECVTAARRSTSSDRHRATKITPFNPHIYPHSKMVRLITVAQTVQKLHL